MTNSKVVIAWCSPGQVETHFMTSVLNLVTVDARREFSDRRILRDGTGFISQLSSPRIASARNKIVRLFLNTPDLLNADWLLMLDTDMVFQDDLLDRLLEVADPEHYPIVGGLAIATNGEKLYPTLKRLNSPEEYAVANEPFSVIADYPEDSLVEVDATGAACLLMHKSALLKMAAKYPEPAPWFAETIYKGYEFGEDITFCLRAASCDIPVYVHTGVKLGHIKPQIITEETWRARLAGE